MDWTLLFYFFRQNRKKEIADKNGKNEKETGTIEERINIVEAAGKIILQDIRGQFYDNESYPPPDNFFFNVENEIPDSLKTLMDVIILTDKKKPDEWYPKIISIAHAIINAARPRSFLSAIQIGLASFLLQKYASKDLIRLLHSLGLCSTYDEATRFQASVTVQNKSSLKLPSNSFSQFVFDNIDHDTRTIDGKNTLHAMAGIQVVTPIPTNGFQDEVPRLKKIPPAEEMGEFGKIALQIFNNKKGSGFSLLKAKNLNDLNPISDEVKISNVDFMWLFKKWSNEKDTPGIIYIDFLR